MSGSATSSRSRAELSATVMINDYAGHPFQIELACEFAGRGHQVHHVWCSNNVTPHGDLESLERLTTHPIDTGGTFEKYNLRRRIADELRYGWLSVQVMRRARPGHVVTSNVPLLSLLVIWLGCRVLRSRWTLWLQDIQAGLAKHSLGGRGLVARILTALEKFLIRRADVVVAISEEFSAETVAMGRKPATIVTIENWAPIGDLPMLDKDNEWARRHGLHDRLVLLYSGTLGRKHSPELLLDLADAVSDSAEVVVVSEGEGASWLAEHPRANLTLLPFQPFDELPQVLATGDVLITLLDPQAGMYSVPSKNLTYLCAGRPIICSVPAENASARLIGEQARAGLVVRPGDSAELAVAAKRLLADPDLRRSLGESARCYAVDTFDIQSIGDRFSAVLGLPPTESETAR
jgi:colanic acid biosynthesis glycosyl transferase WcaI